MAKLIPNSEITSSLSPTSTSSEKNKAIGSDYVSTYESYHDLIQKWYINPLKGLQRNDGFIILIILFPLYEKYLKYKYKSIINKRTNFSEGHQIFKIIGKELSLSESNAFHFWQLFRNGLLHQGKPIGANWQLGSFGEAVKFSEGIFKVDPIVFRDHILSLIEPHLKMWKNAKDFPLIYKMLDDSR